MQGSGDWTEQITLGIRYRIALVAVCTLIYVYSIIQNDSNIFWKLCIAFGMVISCFLSVFVYKEMLIRKQGSEWIQYIVSLELLVYGLFIYLSGGFSSPYFWYYIACLFIMMTIRLKPVIIIAGVLWCLFCATISQPNYTQAPALRLNLAIGTVIITVIFYLLHRIFDQIIHKHQQLGKINSELQQEKQRNEQALQHMRELYATLNLFVMTDPTKVVESLGMTLWRTIAPKGCLLVKLSTDETVEQVVSFGMDVDDTDLIIQEGLSSLYNKGSLSHSTLIINHREFETIFIGETRPIQGIFFREQSKQLNAIPKQDHLYYSLTELIFHNLNLQKQMEEYIASEEQQRLASEIHDTVLQKLFAITCNMRLLETDKELCEHRRFIEQIQDLRCSVELAMKELREAIYGRDFAADGNSISHRLNQFIEDIQKLSGTEIQLHMEANAETMTAAQKVTIYRIISEAVNNAIRHGKAQVIKVCVALEHEMIKAEITDDGSGFSNHKPVQRFHGNGLKNMRRMVYLLKGQFSLETNIDNGTRIKVSLPRT